MSNKKIDKVLRVFNIIVYSLLGLIALTAFLLVFVCDQFVVSGFSMSPTLHSDQHILVSKLSYGARIYKKYDFDSPDLSCFRMPGLGKIEVGDIVAFNYPDPNKNHKIQFRINYVYTKRCIGIPGDTVRIVDGFYKNSRLPETVIGVEAKQRSLREMSDSILHVRGVVLRAFPYNGGLKWTIRNLGPALVPRKGSAVRLDTNNVHYFARAIEYETGVRPTVDDGIVRLGDKEVRTYTFSKDYFFFGGDNLFDSRDSRYFGVVPADFVIGKVVGAVI
ncbi:MAG: signal peptidase I [Bacteroidales bacterium]